SSSATDSSSTTVPSSSVNCSTETSSGRSTRRRASSSSSSRTRALRGDVLRLEQLAHGVRRLGAALQPRADALFVEDDRRRLGLGVVVAARLDHAPVARGALIGDDDAPDGVLATADAGEAKAYGHERRASLASDPGSCGPTARSALCRGPPPLAWPHEGPEVRHPP